MLLFAAALAVRLPNLMLVPRFQDEGVDVLWGLDIARGHGLPLTGADPYYGPLFSYLVALGFYVFGPEIALPRLLAAIVGALTVPATYWLGRRACGRRAALIASILALSSRSLISVSSHYGWSNSLSPFFAVVTLAACCEAYTRRHGGWLIATGALAGLTVQTHPIAATILVGMGAWSLLPSGVVRTFPRGAIVAAAAACLCAYGPMLWATAQSAKSVVGIGETRSYAFSPVTSPLQYAHRAVDLGQTVWLSAVAGWSPYSGLPGGVVSGAEASGGAWDNWTRMAVLGVGLAVASGLVAAAIRGPLMRKLIAWTLLAGLIMLPVGVQIFPTRYVIYLLPLVYVLLADVLARLSLRLVPAQGLAWRRRREYGIRVGAGALLLVALAITPIVTLQGYYAAMGATAGDNRPFFELRDRLREYGACREPVLVEEIGSAVTGRDRTLAYFNRESIRYVLTLDQCPVEVRTVEWLASRLSRHEGNDWLVLSTQTARLLAGRFALSKVFDISTAPPIAPDLRLALYSAAASAGR